MLKITHFRQIPYICIYYKDLSANINLINHMRTYFGEKHINAAYICNVSPIRISFDLQFVNMFETRVQIIYFFEHNTLLNSMNQIEKNLQQFFK